MPDKLWCHSYLVFHWLDFSRFCIISSNLNLVKPDSGQSPVSPNSGFRIWCNILKNLTNGMPDGMWHHSYLVSHWSNFFQDFASYPGTWIWWDRTLKASLVQQQGQNQAWLTPDFPSQVKPEGDRTDKHRHKDVIKATYCKQMLSCMYTNSDQLVNKREDLCMAVTGSEPDIILITKAVP